MSAMILLSCGAFTLAAKCRQEHTEDPMQRAAEYLSVLETMGMVLWACTGYLLGFANEGLPCCHQPAGLAAAQVLVRHALHASPAAYVALFSIGFLTETCLLAAEHGVNFVAGVAQTMEQDQGG